MHYRSIATLVVTILCGNMLSAEDASNESFHPPLFAFQNGVSFGTFEEEAATLKQLGYAGVGSVGTVRLKDRVAAYESAGLKVFSIYVDLDSPGLPAAIEILKNRGAIIELTIRKPIDAKTVKRVQELAEQAKEANLKIAIYPHAGFAIATVEPALDLITKVDRDNVGLNFNLCHFLKGEKAVDLESMIAKAGENIFAVSTCGADVDGNSWKTLIQPLHQGTFDQQRLLNSLKEIGFQGAVGIQCYAVKGDKKSNLEQSMKAWNRHLAKLAN